MAQGFLPWARVPSAGEAARAHAGQEVLAQVAKVAAEVLSHRDQARAGVKYRKMYETHWNRSMPGNGPVQPMHPARRAGANSTMIRQNPANLDLFQLPNHLASPLSTQNGMLTLEIPN
ncbi:hypothetical protein A5647_17130 [Mycobacterium sp. 1100029.7]|nr:hypothetical protein A5647_17130 [Mycobacterium sp. 1100029.7]